MEPVYCRQALPISTSRSCVSENVLSGCVSRSTMQTSDTPYARYFLAHVLQFQFHRALCREAGYTGPLNRCSVYGNKKAGAKFQQMLEMGKSKPWPEALKAVTGEDKMDATAMLDYFAPLKAWLDEQNRELAKTDGSVKP